MNSDNTRSSTIDDELELQVWAAAFRNAAVVDGCALLRVHLRKFDLPGEPELLLEGTIDMVAMCAAYVTLDGRSLSDFLAWQAYEPINAGDATYVLTFDLYAKGYARVVTGPRIGIVDFADLYEVPWHRYQIVGYSAVLISRADGAALGAEELRCLEQEITEDLRFDYGEDELDFWFDPDTHDGALAVTVRDVLAIEGKHRHDDPGQE